MPKIASMTPSRRPRRPQKASRCLLDAQDRFQDASKTAQTVPKRPPEDFKTPKIASKAPPLPPKRPPQASKLSKIASKTFQTVSKKPPNASKMSAEPSKTLGA